MADVEREVRQRIGQQGIRELWREQEVSVQRWGTLSRFLVSWHRCFPPLLSLSSCLCLPYKSEADPAYWLLAIGISVLSI
jgi:hypothetical protein